MQVSSRCLLNSPEFRRFKARSLVNASSDAQTKFKAIGIVHERVLPTVLSNLVNSRGHGIGLKGKQDWVTKTDKDNQIATIQAFQDDFPQFRHIGEEDTQPPVDRELTTEHLTGNTVINDGVDGTSFFAGKTSNKFGLLSFIVGNPSTEDFREFAYQIIILFAGQPIYAGIFAPQLKLDSTNNVSVLEAVDGLPGAWLNGEKVEFAAIGQIHGSKPLMSFIDAPYGTSLTQYLKDRFGISSYFPMVSSVACEAALLVRRPDDEIGANYSFALYSAKAAKLWDWLPGGYIVEKAGGRASLVVPGNNGFEPRSLFPVSADYLVPRGSEGIFAPEIKWPIIYGSKSTVDLIISAMNEWPDRDQFRG